MTNSVYHPVLNGNGTYKASDNKFWYETTVPLNSVADCFIPANIGTVNGRPDSKSDQYVYAENFVDVREYSKILNRDEVNLIIADKEENGVEEVVYFNNHRTLESANYSGQNSIYRFTSTLYRLRLNTLSTTILPYIGQTIYITEDSSTGQSIGYVSNIYVGGTGVGYIDFTLISDTSSPTLLPATDGTSVLHNLAKLAFTYTKPILSSNTKLSNMVYGNPQFYPQVLKDRLASGVGVVGLLADLVDDTGASNLPNGSKTVFKLNGKFTTTHQVLKSTNSGLTWTALTLTTHYTVNTITNSITFVTAPASTDIILIADTDKCLPYIQTTPKPVISVEPKVIASNSNSIYKGCMMTAQITGKIPTGS